MTTNIELRKGILFVRLEGNFTHDKIYDFESIIIPLVLIMSLKGVNIDLSKVEEVSNNNINSIIKISNIVSRYDGKVVISGINDKIKLTLRKSDLFDYCFKSRNERHSREVFSI